MGRIRAAFVICIISAAAASAAELPARKAGLWEITTIMGSHSVKVQQCTDAASDQAMQARAAGGLSGDCAKRDVQKSGSTITVDSVCTFGGKTMVSHMVITGSFDREYTMTMTSQAPGMPVGPLATLNAKWLGPCAENQKPGDMIMPNGMKMNVLDRPKGLGQEGASGPPGH